MSHVVGVLGVSVDGPDPVGPTHLRLAPGVSVLYGVNGAGKTALLRAIASAFAGIRLKGAHLADLHIAIDPERDWFLHDELPPLIAEGIVHDRWTLSVELEEVTDWKLEELPEDFEGLAKVRARMFTRDEALAEEVAAQRIITCRGLASGKPGWTIFLSALIDEVSSDLQAILRQRGSKPGGFGDLYTPPGYQQAPSWVPIPLVPLCQVERQEFFMNPIPNVVSADSSSDLLADTVRLLRTMEPDGGDRREPINLIESVSSTDFALAEEVEVLRTKLASFASQVAETVLLDAPVLDCHIPHPERWLESPPVDWRGWESASQTWVSLDDLSSAQKRWTRMAVELALSQNLGAVLVDEPELALHRLAERHCVEGLQKLAEWLSVPVIVTSHSADFLNDPDCHRFHVLRGSDGRTRVDLLDDPVQRDLERAASSLGLSNADVMQMVRVFLIVEGDHDVAVIHQFIGTELAGIPAVVLPMRGTHNLLSLLDAQFLFRFTDAAVVVALDRVRVPELDQKWQRAVQLVESENEEKALRVLSPLRTAKTSEATLLYELCIQALQQGGGRRLRLFGFDRKGIEHYLPPSAFVEGASWETLEKQWRRERQEGESFKQWMARVHSAPITTESVTQVASAMDEVPDEFAQLLDLCFEAAKWRRPVPG